MIDFGLVYKEGVGYRLVPAPCFSNYRVERGDGELFCGWGVLGFRIMVEDHDCGREVHSSDVQSVWAAASEGNVRRVETLVQRRGDANIRDAYGYTAIIYAARAGKIEVVKRLIGQLCLPLFWKHLGG